MCFIKLVNVLDISFTFMQILVLKFTIMYYMEGGILNNQK